MQTNRLLRSAIGFAAAAVMFAAPASAQIVVQYQATLTSGFGDGPATGPGDIGPDTANNGFPACAATILGANSSATQAKVSFGGLATVTTAATAGPRKVSFKKAGPGNGLQTTCLSTQTKIPPFLTVRIQSSALSWPGVTGTFSAGGGFGGPAGAPFVHIPNFNQNQSVLASTIPLSKPPRPSPRFGGSIRANGKSNAFLGIVTPGFNVFTGTLPVVLSVGAEGGTATPTFQTTNAAPFQLKGGGPPTIPGVARQVLFPWTTGRVVASDRTGNFHTFRERFGLDNRNGAGTTGTLQLVTPMLVDIRGIAPLPFAPTSVLRVTFTPEPGATLLLAGGALALLVAHAAWRRRAR